MRAMRKPGTGQLKKRAAHPEKCRGPKRRLEFIFERIAENEQEHKQEQAQDAFHTSGLGG